MIARWLCLVALLLTLVLSGCGGGGSSPAVIAGNYFPLTIGTVWQYSTILEAETVVENFDTTGSMTRTLVGTENITIDGSVISTYVFQHDYTTSGTPAFTSPADITVAPFVNYLFSAPGGLHSVRAYYRPIAATPDAPAHVELVALSRVGGPLAPVTPPRPFLFTPPYHGFSQQVNMWFTPLPLMPFPTDMSDTTVREKTLDFGGFTSDVLASNAVVSIYYYNSNLNVGGNVAALDGRGRTFFQDTIGLTGGQEFTDWYATINVDGTIARVTSRIKLLSVTP